VQRVLNDWLTSCLQLSSDQQKLARQELAAAVAKETFRRPGLLSARVTLLAAEVFGEWPEDKVARVQASQYRELLASATHPRDRLLLDGLHLLTLAREREISAARNAAQTWDPGQLTDSLWMQLIPAFVEAIDFAEGQQPTSWSNLLRLQPAAAGLISEASPEMQAQGLRIRNWYGDPAAVASLEALAARYPRSGALQLELALALVDVGADRLDDATAILKRLAASSPRGSPLNLKARWRWLRNLQLAGREDVARQQAQLLLASLAIDSELWRKRLQAIAR
jgi:hypothetical protein